MFSGVNRHGNLVDTAATIETRMAHRNVDTCEMTVDCDLYYRLIPEHNEHTQKSISTSETQKEGTKIIYIYIIYIYIVLTLMLYHA